MTHDTRRDAICSRCGQALPADAPGGYCPRCLLAAGLTASLSPEKPGPLDALRVEEVAPASPESPPRRFGDYELLSLIAHGGMGIVYRARQISLHRIVALKMLLLGRSAAADDRLRFLREAEAAANLHHPNIVTVHEIGMHEGQYFFSMEYVEGRTLAEVGHGGLPPHRAARYLATIAEAIEYAHQSKILHRDLKPSNVIIDARDQPRITDFGLAKRFTDSADLTLTGQLLGSPGYIPPEQAGARPDRIGPASDIFSLGAILYYLLTGRPPFLAERLEDTLLKVLREDPVPPRLLSPTLPIDLETICLKCLEKEPAKRYPTARALADDLNRFLEGKPVEARRVGPAGKAWRWCRRKPVIAGLILSLVIVFAAGLGGVIFQWRKAKASDSLTRANLYDADMSLAGQALEEHDLGLALKLLEAHLPRPGEEDLRGWEWRYFRRQCEGDELATLGSHQLSAQCVVFSPDGATLASAGEDSFKLWDVASRREIASGVHTAERRPVARSRIAFSPRGTLIATSGIDNVVRLWERAPLRQVGELVHEEMVTAMEFSPDGAHLATVNRGSLSTDGVRHARFNHWEVATRKVQEQVEIDNSWCLAYSPDGSMVAIGKLDGRIVLWDRARNDTSRQIDTRLREVRIVAFSPDGNLLASVGFDHDLRRKIRIWQVATGSETCDFMGHADRISSLAFSPDGRVLASAGSDRVIKLWSPDGCREIDALRGHKNEVWGVAFSPDGRLLASSGKDGEVKLWSTAPRERQPDSVPLPEGNRWFVLSPGGESLLVSTRDRTLQLWDTVTLRLIAAFPDPVAELSFGAVSPGGAGFATGTEAGRIDLWESPRTRPERVATLAQEAGADCLAFSHDGRTLAGGGADGTIRWWETSPPRRREDLGAPSARIRSITFSQDDRLVAAARTDWTVEVWDRIARRPIAVLAGHKGMVIGIAASPGGRTLATTSYDATAKLWDLDSGSESGSLESQLFGLHCASFSTDGRRLAVGGADGTIKLWDLRLHRTVATLRGHRGEVAALAFLPDGDSLVTVSEDRLAIWRAAPSAAVTVMPGKP